MDSSAWANILPIVVIVALIWLMISRQRKRSREVSDLQSSLSVGADIMLGSGIFGTIRSLDDDRAGVEVAENVVISVDRRAITRVVQPAEEPPVDAAESVVAGTDVDDGADYASQPPHTARAEGAEQAEYADSESPNREVS